MLIDYFEHNNHYKNHENWSGLDYDFKRDWFWFLKNSLIERSDALFELGCGSAPYLFQFLLITNDYTGLDIAPNAIETAQRRISKTRNGVHFICSNFLDKFNITHKYDLIVDSFFLHCIIASDRTKVLKKIYELMKDDGELWINTMCNPPRDYELLKSFNSETKCMEVIRNGEKISVRQFDSPDEINNLILKVGFKLFDKKVISDDSQDNYLAIYRK